MTGKLLPKAAGEFIASRSADVSVVTSGVEFAAKMISSALLKGDFGLQSWSKEPLHPKLPVDADEAAIQSAVDWVFFVDALNFSFWSEETREKRYTVSYKGEQFVGYWSLCAAVLRGQSPFSQLRRCEVVMFILSLIRSLVARLEIKEDEKLIVDTMPPTDRLD